jgi:cytochrome c553
VIIVVLLLFLSAMLSPAQQPFASHCAACHGEDARGTAKGPGLAMNPRVAEQSAEQLRAYLERGNPGAGMPSFADLSTDELVSLVRFLRRINADTILVPEAAPASARKITWGAPQPGDWLTYNGNDSANRLSSETVVFTRGSRVESAKKHRMEGVTREVGFSEDLGRWFGRSAICDFTRRW